MSEPYLRMILLTEPNRSELVQALSGMVEGEIARSKGARGIALRHGLRVAQRRHPGALARLVNELIPEWIDTLEPHYENWVANGSGSFGEYLVARQEDLAWKLLLLVKGRVRASNHRLARTAARCLGIESLRSALPRFGVLVDDYVSVG